MLTDFQVELIGYFAAVLVILSFIIKNDMRKTRTVNLLGAIVFIIYGAFKEAPSIVITNVVLGCVQCYYLFIKKD